MVKRLIVAQSAAHSTCWGCMENVIEVCTRCATQYHVQRQSALCTLQGVTHVVTSTHMMMTLWWWTHDDEPTIMNPRWWPYDDDPTMIKSLDKPWYLVEPNNGSLFMNRSDQFTVTCITRVAIVSTLSLYRYWFVCFVAKHDNVFSWENSYKAQNLRQRFNLRDKT